MTKQCTKMYFLRVARAFPSLKPSFCLVTEAVVVVGKWPHILGFHMNSRQPPGFVSEKRNAGHDGVPVSENVALKKCALTILSENKSWRCAIVTRRVYCYS